MVCQGACKRVRLSNYRCGWLAVAALLFVAPQASAQKVTVSEEQTLKNSLSALAGPGTQPFGQAVGLATALEIGTTPLGTATGGFVFKLDRTTGLLTRTLTTFGPTFSERASTSGEGQVSVGALFSSITFDQLSDRSLTGLRLGAVNSSSSLVSQTNTANISLTGRLLTLSGAVGVTDNLDVSVVIPMVSLVLDATSNMVRGDGVLVRNAQAKGTFSGLGDVSAQVKYRVARFGAKDALQDTGGVSIVVGSRLPTGDKVNLRGLGVTRTLVGAVVSAERARLQPHASVSFEYWNKGVTAQTNTSAVVTARHQVQYAAGVSVEATPKVTFIVDLLGQQVRGAGEVGSATTAGTGLITGTETLVALPNGINKVLVVPGLKINLKGKMLLSLDALTTLRNNGLRPTVTPVVGLNLTL